jgi:hypothetical protein
MKVYLLIYSHPNINLWLYEMVDKRTAIVKYLDTRPEVLNWVTPFPNGILVTSESDAATLARLLDKEFTGYHFLIAEIPQGTSNGMLPPEIWEFINKPKSSGRWQMGLSFGQLFQDPSPGTEFLTFFDLKKPPPPSKLPGGFFENLGKPTEKEKK